MTVRTLHILNTYRITNIRTVCPALLRRYVIEIDWKLKFEVIKPAGTNWNLRWIILYLCNLLGRVRYSTACHFPSGNLLYNNDRQFRVQINNSVWLGSKKSFGRKSIYREQLIQTYVRPLIGRYWQPGGLAVLENVERREWSLSFGRVPFSPKLQNFGRKSNGSVKLEY